MAKKKKNKKPSTQRGSTGQASKPTTSDAAAATPTAKTAPTVDSARARREAAQRKRERDKRKKQAGKLGALVLVIALILGFVAFKKLQSSKEAAEAAKVAAAAGCSKVKSTGDSGEGEHMVVGEAAPKYDTSPPTHGRHWPGAVPAGVYDKPFTAEAPTAAQGQDPSIPAAVHSLEHAYVIIWHKGLSDADLKSIEKEYGDMTKVIVVPYPQLTDGKITMTAWGVTQTCQKPSDEIIKTFVAKYRNARSAPEPFAQ